MIYTFHAGDYARLERADGTLSKTLTGYVFSYERSGRFHSFIFKWDDGTETGWSGNIENLPQNFTRIGKYDFALIRGMLKNCGYAEKDEFDKISSMKPLMIPESLHEGDFVETVDGRVGYIKSICRCEKCRERGFYERPYILRTVRRTASPSTRRKTASRAISALAGGKVRRKPKAYRNRKESSFCLKAGWTRLKSARSTN